MWQDVFSCMCPVLTSSTALCKCWLYHFALKTLRHEARHINTDTPIRYLMLVVYIAFLQLLMLLSKNIIKADAIFMENKNLADSQMLWS